MNTSTHNPLDKENLRQVILDFPHQFETGFGLVKDFKISGNFDSVCISGMGGSSLPSDVLKTYVNSLRQKDPVKNKSFRILRNRGYTLPVEAYENCLNIFISYSGNTEETLASLNEAIKNSLPSIGLANGGKLEKICREKNIPFLEIPDVSQPRYATGYFLSALLGILRNAGLIENISKTILGSVAELKKITTSLEKTGKLLAKKVAGKTPVIHTAEELKSVGRIWKIKINENAKTPAFSNFYPELNHNEMVGFTLPQCKFHLITLVDKKAGSKIEKRMKITVKLLEKKGVKNSFVEIPSSKNMFLKIFFPLAIADWMSYYLALEYGQDPTPVDMVEDLKKML